MWRAWFLGPQREEGWGTNFLTIFVRQTFYCTLSMLRALLMKRGGWFDQVRTTLLRTWNLSKKRSFNGSFRLLKETGLRWPAQLRLEVSQKQVWNTQSSGLFPFQIHSLESWRALPLLNRSFCSCQY